MHFNQGESMKYTNIAVSLITLGTLNFANANEIADNAKQRCIVQLNSALEDKEVKGLAQAFSQRANASIKYVYTHSINGFTINMPCHAAKTAFGDSEYVTALEVDQIITLNKKPTTNPGKDSGTTTEEPSQTISYGTTRVGGPVNSSDKTAWIIDSGIDLDHPDLNVDTSKGFTTISRGGMDDQNGHGTHVAGIIAAIDNNIGSVGVAEGATVVPVRVLDRRGSGSVSGVIAGVDHVAANASQGDCVNMSLGGGISTSLDNAVVSAAEKTSAYFSLAAGNESDDANNHSPARVNGTNIYTISAIDSNDAMASFSNYGAPVDYAAPGVAIFSLWKNGGTNTISGTSMASPHACAVLMIKDGNVTNDGYASNDPDDVSDPIISLGNN